MLSSGLVQTRASVATSLTLMATSHLDRSAVARHRWRGRLESGPVGIKEDAVPGHATEPDGLPCQGPWELMASTAPGDQSNRATSRARTVLGRRYPRAGPR